MHLRIFGGTIIAKRRRGQVGLWHSLREVVSWAERTTDECVDPIHLGAALPKCNRVSEDGRPL